MERFLEMHIAQNWRMNGQRYSLKGIRCENCDKMIFPVRDICPHCQQSATKRSVEIITTTALVLERAAR